MSEYIDREKIMLKTCSDCTRQVNLVCKHPEPCEKLISAFLCEEQEDVAPVVHGKWVGKPIAGYCNIRCSVCDKIYYNNGKWKYCPNCGAKMDLE